MGKDYQFIVRDGEYSILTEETEIISLKMAVSGLAMSTYATLLNLGNTKDADEKKRLEEKISFQSKVLDSISNALSSIRHC